VLTQRLLIKYSRLLQIILLVVGSGHSRQGFGYQLEIGPILTFNIDGLLALFDTFVVVALLQIDGRLIVGISHTSLVQLDGLVVMFDGFIELLGLV